MVNSFERAAERRTRWHVDVPVSRHTHATTLVRPRRLIFMPWNKDLGFTSDRKNREAEILYRDGTTGIYHWLETLTTCQTQFLRAEMKK